MAPIDIVQAQAEEATRRQALVNAEATRQNAGARAEAAHRQRHRRSGVDVVAQSDRCSHSWSKRPLTSRPPCAMPSRTAPTSLRRRRTSTPPTCSFAAWTTRPCPQLNLQGTYRLDGRGGTTTAGPAVPPPTNWWNALGGIGNVEAPTWTVQMNFSYPLGTSAAEANKARQQIIIRQNQTAVKATELQIATDVTAASIAIRNSLEAIKAATAARELSVKRAEAAQSKLDVGMATNFEVVQAQRDLADAPQPGTARAPQLSPRAHRLPAHSNQPEVKNAECRMLKAEVRTRVQHSSGCTQQTSRMSSSAGQRLRRAWRAVATRERAGWGPASIKE